MPQFVVIMLNSAHHPFYVKYLYLFNENILIIERKQIINTYLNTKNKKQSWQFSWSFTGLKSLLVVLHKPRPESKWYIIILNKFCFCN